MKKLCIILAILLLITPLVFSARVVLPEAELRCYNEFAYENSSYNFILRSNSQENATGNTLYIKTFDEVCRYAKSPRSCYDCIVLTKYGIWEARKNQTNNEMTTENNNIPIKIIFSIAIVLLLMVFIYQIISKTKFLKRKKNKWIKKR